MILTHEKARHLKMSMLDPTLPQMGLTAPEMMDLLNLAVSGLAAMHFTASTGSKCADCTIDDEPCRSCYAAWWDRKHPNVQLLREGGV